MIIQGRRAIIFAFVAVFGCSPSSSLVGPPPIELSPPDLIDEGESFRPDQLPPILTILKPKPGDKFHEGDSIECEVELDRKQQRKLPTFVDIIIEKVGASRKTSTPMVPKERSDSKIRLAAQLQAPRGRGTFAIYAVALKMVITRPNSETGAKMKSVNHRTASSSRINIQVIKRQD